MPSLGTIWAELGLRLDKFDQALQQAEAKIRQAEEKTLAGVRQVGERLSAIGKDLSTKVTLPLVGIGAAALKTSMDFDSAMANVATLIPGNIERVRELKAAVQEMAVDVGKRTGDLAEGLYQVISAFGDTADTVKILEINAKAAAAGLATTTDAINLTSAVTKGYGDISARAVQKVSDLAFQAVKLGQTTFPELAASIGRVTPLAASLGVSMEELFGVMATGTGVTGTAAEVSTQLRGVLQALMAPTDTMAKLIKTLGFESGQAMVQQLGLQKTIEVIVGSAQKSKLPLQDFIGSIEGQTLALALAGPQAETFTQKLQAMQQATGATDEAFREQTEGVGKAAFTWGQFIANLEVASQRIGDQLAPTMQSLLDTVSRAVTWFTNLDDRTQKVILTVGALAAAIGPALMLIGSMAQGISALAAAKAFLAETAIGTKLIPALGRVVLAVQGLLASMGPIGWTIMGISAVVTAFAVAWEKNWFGIRDKAAAAVDWLSRKWEAFKEWTARVWEGIKDFLADWWPYLVGALAGPVGIFAAWLYKNWDRIKEQAVAAWDAIKAAVVEKVRTWWSIGINLAEGIWQGLQNAAAWLRERVLGWVKAVLPDVIERFLGIGSPARLMIEHGQAVAEGLAVGINLGASKAKAAATALVEQVNKTMEGLGLAVEVARAKFALLEARFTESGNQAEVLKAKLEAQKAELELVNQRVATLSAAYERMKSLKGETATETQRLYLELLREQKAQLELSNAIAQVNEQLRQQQQIKFSVEAGRVTMERSWTTPESKRVTVVEPIGKTPVEQAREAMGERNWQAAVKAMAEAKGVDLGVAEAMVTTEWMKKKGLIPGLQLGGVVTRPTLALLAERGPEAVMPLNWSGLGAALARAIAQYLKPSVHLETHVHSPEPLSPSEVARRNRQMLRELALEWGIA